MTDAYVKSITVNENDTVFIAVRADGLDAAHLLSADEQRSISNGRSIDDTAIWLLYVDEHDVIVSVPDEWFS